MFALGIAFLVVVQNYIYGVRIVEVSLDIIDKTPFRQPQAGYRDPVPGIPPIAANSDKAIVSTCIEQAFLYRRFTQGGDSVIIGHGPYIPGVVPGLLPPHDRQ